MTILATHLLTSRTFNHFTTACGKEGIPLNPAYSFSPGSSLLEGRRPATAGCGIQATTSLEFGVPSRAVKWCGRCMKRYAKGEGI